MIRALAAIGRRVREIDQPPALYETICRLVVDPGCAAMAWIAMVEGDTLVPVAWSDTARECATVCVLIADLEQVVVCNDLSSDACAHPGCERARQLGMKASGVFPIRRAGRVFGSLNLSFDEAGAFDGALMAVAELIVCDLCFALDQIDREVARMQAVLAAKEGELRLAGLVDNALDAILAVDPQFKVVIFNRAAGRMFGVEPGVAIGRGIDSFILSELRAAHGVHLALHAADGVASHHMGLRSNGEVFPMGASITRSGEGDRRLLTIIARDLTSVHAAEKILLARTKSESANLAKTDFLSRISHELRTPLNAVIGFAQLMNQDNLEPVSQRQHERLELMLQAGHHLRTLIDDLLDASNIEAGRMAIESRVIELRSLLDGVLKMCEPHALQCQVELAAVHGAEAPVMVRSDPARLRQVMLNLLSNAIKYNHPGGHVRVEVTQEARFLRVAIRDNGIGMTLQQTNNLYQPFNRLGRESSAVEGTGIGLVLARQLVEAMGGELTMRSESGAGSVAEFTVPAADAPGTVSGNEDDQPQPTGSVLYIEDNPVNSVIVEQMLAGWPAVRLVIAVDGATGLERARALQPDVVLLDMQLPDMDGISVLRQLKADEATRALVVVILSASAVPDVVETTLAAGAFDYWKKPMDYEQFIANMRELLRPTSMGQS